MSTVSFCEETVRFASQRVTIVAGGPVVGIRLGMDCLAMVTQRS